MLKIFTYLTFYIDILTSNLLSSDHKKMKYSSLELFHQDESNGSRFTSVGLIHKKIDVKMSI
jgi:hypothetical protein